MSEKFPWLFERRFGIRAFDYWWGYTSCEIDLLTIDQPTIDSNYKKNKKKSMIATPKEEAELNALNDAWEKKRNGRSYAGKEFSLSDFVAGKL